MSKVKIGLTSLLLSVTLIALSAHVAEAQSEAPPGGDFQKVSELVELPEFVPGLGVLWVDPGTLPTGPFLAYDRDGELMSTIYMVPLDDLTDRRELTDLGAADTAVDHVDFRFNAGHPGIPEPHYHVILWHVSAEEAVSLQG
jgi:hypothetical protein